MLLNRIVMNIFDIITIIIALFAIFNGWRKGFISQLLSLVGIVGGVALAITFGDEVGALFKIDAAYSKVVGFIITFFVAAIVALGLFFRESIKLFISKKVSILHWILYLCTVEILPFRLLWQAVIRLR